MTYTVLARKYRPQSFDELVGQEHVARTIGNAIASGRVAHAFLFTGVRGVGKTTTARILAKSLNCEQGPTAQPCNTCGPCVDITAGRDVDVLEIDGASNNGVDDVRRLQESLPFRPARDRFKIVIVDEVHMLSTGAFNAFLKTLEEPPAHVKFIFATTESHKVPVTIRSRCQRYDFRLIPQSVVAGRVRHVLALEGIEADDGTVAIVAREAAGSMRDALTLLDQIVAFGGSSLHADEVARVLGVAARDSVRGLARALVEGEPRAALTSLRHALDNGADPLHFGKQVLETLRDLAVVAVTDDDASLVDWVEEERVFARSVTKAVPAVELQRLFSMATRVVDEVSRSATPAIALEMGVLRVASRPRLSGLDELLARLEALEQRLAAGGGAGGGGPSGGSSAGGRGGGRPEDRGPSGPRATAVESGPRAHANPEPPAVVAEPASTRTERAETRTPTAGAVSTPPAAAVSTPPAAHASPSPASVPPPADAPSRPSAAPRRNPMLDFGAIVGHLRSRQPALAAIVEQAEARVVTREKLVLGFLEGSFFGRQASQPDALEAIAEAALAVLGGKPAVDVRLDVKAGSSTRTLADVERSKTAAERESRKREALSHPVVRDALDVFPEARGKEDVRFEDEA